jgi:hypothetical protein
MSLKKRLALVTLLILVVALAYLLFAPVPITPEAWTPPAAPSLTGQYEQNSRKDSRSAKDTSRKMLRSMRKAGFMQALKTEGSWSCNQMARSHVCLLTPVAGHWD